MSLTYKESNDLINDFEFRGRIKVAALILADFYLNEAPNTPSHNSRYRWAQDTFRNPESVAALLQPPTVMDPAVQGSGAAIADDALKSAVEGVVNKII